MKHQLMELIMKKFLIVLSTTILSLNVAASSSSRPSTPYALLENAESHARQLSYDLRDAMDAYPEDSPQRAHLRIWNEMIVKLGRAIAENKKSFK